MAQNGLFTFGWATCITDLRSQKIFGIWRSWSVWIGPAQKLVHIDTFLPLKTSSLNLLLGRRFCCHLVVIGMVCTNKPPHLCPCLSWVDHHRLQCIHPAPRIIFSRDTTARVLVWSSSFSEFFETDTPPMNRLFRLQGFQIQSLGRIFDPRDLLETTTSSSCDTIHSFHIRQSTTTAIMGMSYSYTAQSMYHACW